MEQLKLPTYGGQAVIEGVIMLWDAMGLGIRALTISANTQTGENEKIEGPALYATLALAVAFAAGLFFVTPAALGHFAEQILAPTALLVPAGDSNPGVYGESKPTPTDPTPDTQIALRNWAPWVGNLIEGLTRLAILIGYIAVVGLIPDV